MTTSKEIVVLTETVRVQQIQKDDYISLTDIAKYRNADDPRFVIQNWMRTRFTVEFLGIWEQLDNPDFNRVEFEAVKNESGSNAPPGNLEFFKVPGKDAIVADLEGKEA